MKVKIDTIEALAKQPQGRMLADNVIESTAQLAVSIFVRDMKQWLTPISMLPLSVRANNVMVKHKIHAVYHLRAMDPKEVVNLKHAGRRVRAEIREMVLNTCNLKLPNWEEGMMKGAQS